MTPWKSSPWLLIDTETTGIDPVTHRIVELAMVTMVKGEVTDSACAYLDPEMPIPPEASAVNGITDAMVKGKPTMAKAQDRIVARLKRHVDVSSPVVAYNASFDVAMLTHQCGGFAQVIERAAVLDPLVLVRHVDRFATGAGRHKLAAACKRHGVELDRAHTAAADAIAAGRLLHVLASHLPDDLAEAVAQLDVWRVEQEREREEWLKRKSATQPSLPLHARSATP